MKMRTQILLGYAVVLTLMVLTAAVMYSNSRALNETRRWVRHTQEVRLRAHELLSAMLDLETGVRGFALTGDERFLEPYQRAQTAIHADVEALRELVADNPPQVARVKRIGDLVERWIRELGKPLIEARRKASRDAEAKGGQEKSLQEKVVRLAASGKGKALVDAIRVRVAAFSAVEDKLLSERLEHSKQANARSTFLLFLGTAIAVVLGLLIGLLITRRVLRQVGGEPALIAHVAEQVSTGDLEAEPPGDRESATGINAALGRMLHALRADRDRTERDTWLKTGIAKLGEVLRGDPSVERLAAAVVSELAGYLGAQIAALYIASEDRSGELELVLRGSFAFTRRKNLADRFKPGEGLVGQAALEKQQIVLQNVPEDYIKISSALGERTPSYICVAPIMDEGRVAGVIELGFLEEISGRQLEYLDRATPALAVALQTARSRAALADALASSQALSEELQTQQEELKASNEELEQQTRALQQSEERLRVQQEEMEVVNEELEEKNELLEQQKRDVERGRKELELRAKELALASKYKSEFLANMSHELRTPLNSLLLLAGSLADNKEGNLTDDQVKSARIIRGAGDDLLTLINDILDLAKIEAGQMVLHPAELSLSSLAEGLESSFAHMAREKGIELEIAVEESAPAELRIDRRRVEQVLKNLLSNAIKFTEQGKVSVRIGTAADGVKLRRDDLDSGSALAIAVNDTGIGIPPEQQALVFEAFQQADGSVTRRYSGTGLGLSISRELASLLGGELQLESAPGVGSTFTLYLPIEGPPASSGAGGQTTKRGESAARPAVTTATPAPAPVSSIERSIDDDRDAIGPGDRVILVVEDDDAFAAILLGLCHERSLKCVVAPSGEAALGLARSIELTGVLLDIGLPGIDGWTTLQRLKEDPVTRDVPVHVVSAEDAPHEALRRGAIGHLTKPVERRDLERVFRRIEELGSERVGRVLVVEDEEATREWISAQIAEADVEVSAVATGAAALEALRERRFDCVVLDLGLDDIRGEKLLEQLSQISESPPPVIIYTAKDLSGDDALALREYSETIVVKDVRSRERLLDEVSLFLHRVTPNDAQPPRQNLGRRDQQTEFEGKQILIVDDDMRTLFALSQLLVDRGAKTLKAEDGEKALAMLDEHPNVDLVLMDVMMPVMDGIEAIRRIRAQQRFSKLPVISVTAKAMKEDHDRCVAAGASDYLPKPVDQQRLLAMLRVWLSR